MVHQGPPEVPSKTSKTATPRCWKLHNKRESTEFSEKTASNFWIAAFQRARKAKRRLSLADGAPKLQISVASRGQTHPENQVCMPYKLL